MGFGHRMRTAALALAVAALALPAGAQTLAQNNETMFALMQKVRERGLTPSEWRHEVGKRRWEAQRQIERTAETIAELRAGGVR